jgi:type III restriction enzyme
MTGQVTERSAFGDKATPKPSGKEPVARDFKLADFGRSILGFATDANDFFHFASLKTYFPKLASASQFLASDAYLGGVTVAVRGLPEDLDALTSRQKLGIAQYVLHQIENGVKRESVEYVGTKNFKPHKISECFTDKTLKLRTEGETGLSWVKGESNVPGLDQIDLTAKDWHAYDDSYGTDQEKHFIKYLNDHADRLRERYDDFHLLRNEKAVKLFSFENGKTFEPDFLLFLRSSGDGKETIMQLFIEPKGSHLADQDKWKEDFLKQLKNDAKMHILFQGSGYKIIGLPFFNDSAPGINDFREGFNSTVGIDGKP